MAIFKYHKEEVLSEIEKKKNHTKDLRNSISSETTADYERHASILDDRIETLEWVYDLVKQIEISEPSAPYRLNKILLP